jgi:predicted NUDIX family phosphoesterase
MSNVLVVPVSALESLWKGRLFQGVVPSARLSLSEVLGRALLVDRDQAERDPELKQLIPYVVFSRNGHHLAYERAARSGEARLQGRVSIGFGGHIEEEDMESGWSSSGPRRELSYRRALEREIDEELLYEPDLRSPRFEHVAWCNDDSTPVGQVHLGVVHVQRVSSLEVQSHDPAIQMLGFADPKVLARMEDLLESWSRHCLGAGFKGL